MLCTHHCLLKGLVAASIRQRSEHSFNITQVKMARILIQKHKTGFTQHTYVMFDPAEQTDPQGISRTELFKASLTDVFDAVMSMFISLHT